MISALFFTEKAAAHPYCLKRARRSFEFTYTQQAERTSYHYNFSSKTQDALLFPAREQPAHGKQGSRCHLRQLLPRQVDFQRAIHSPAYLRKQPNQLTSQAWGHPFSRYLSKSAFEHLQALCHDTHRVALKEREPL